MSSEEKHKIVCLHCKHLVFITKIDEQTKLWHDSNGQGEYSTICLNGDTKKEPICGCRKAEIKVKDIMKIYDKVEIGVSMHKKELDEDEI